MGAMLLLAVYWVILTIAVRRPILKSLFFLVGVGLFVAFVVSQGHAKSGWGPVILAIGSLMIWMIGSVLFFLVHEGTELIHDYETVKEKKLSLGKNKLLRLRAARLGILALLLGLVLSPVFQRTLGSFPLWGLALAAVALILLYDYLDPSPPPPSSSKPFVLRPLPRRWRLALLIAVGTLATMFAYVYLVDY